MRSFLVLLVLLAGCGSSSADHGDGSCVTTNVSCVCVCPSGSNDCVEQECPVSSTYCFGPEAGCPSGQICRSIGLVCTPVCNADGTCPAGLTVSQGIP